MKKPSFFKRKKWWGLPVLVHWTTDSCVLCCSPLRCRGRALTGQVCTHTHTWRYRKSHAFACYAGQTDQAQSCVLYKLINTLLNLPPLYTHNYWHRGTEGRNLQGGEKFTWIILCKKVFNVSISYIHVKIPNNLLHVSKKYFSLLSYCPQMNWS